MTNSLDATKLAACRSAQTSEGLALSKGRAWKIPPRRLARSKGRARCNSTLGLRRARVHRWVVFLLLGFVLVLVIIGKIDDWIRPMSYYPRPLEKCAPHFFRKPLLCSHDRLLCCAKSRAPTSSLPVRLTAGTASVL